MLYLLQIDALSRVELENDLRLLLVHLIDGLQSSDCHVSVVDPVVV